MSKALALWLSCIFLSIAAFNVHGGGSGYNVLVVVNTNSTNSVIAGNYYRALRNIPPQNYLRINWTGSYQDWYGADFTNNLLNPVLSWISTNGLTNQIDYVVLSMDIPYRLDINGYEPNSTTSSLFYGFQADTAAECELATGSSNAYAASESIFRQTPPSPGLSNFFMVTMITSSNDLSLAEMEMEQGALSDSTFPTNTVWLCKGPSDVYNVRYMEYDNAIFNTRLRGNYSVQRTNTQDLFFPPYILGAQTGAYWSSVGNGIFCAPGALVDTLNSYAGKFLEDSGETEVPSFFYAGACASYGAVTEPCNYPQKFPDSQNYFYQSRGFSACECYYQSVTNIYQGLVCGEPLAAPFAKKGAGAWNSLSSNAIISGTTNLSGAFTESDAQHPLQQVDLFMDGNWIETLTNIPPQTGNVINVTINGFPTNYTVTANATLKSIASNLVSRFNTALYASSTKVSATWHGDRIELHSTAAYTKTGPQITISASSTNSSGALTTFIHTANAAPTSFLDTVAAGIQYYDVTGTPTAVSIMTLSVTKTNNSIVTVTVTNTSGTTNLYTFVQQFVTAINSTSSLQGPDGLYGEDVQQDNMPDEVLFNLQPQSTGYAAAQIKATVTGTSFAVTPAGANTMTANVSDLQPRQHLYITAGVSNLAFTVPFNTANYADGYHELAAVAYEGSSVHTQTRLTQDVIIRNTGLSATMTVSLAGSVSNLQPSLQITVTANTNNIASIQLFSTGGLLASATNQSSAMFPIVLTNLNIGTHPFYAIVAQSNGHQYRTQTQTIGLTGVTYANQTLMGIDYPFPVQAVGNPPRLSWPATAGRSYTILSTTNLFTPFQARATVVPTNSIGQWTETNTSPAQQFYSVSVTP